MNGVLAILRLELRLLRRDLLFGGVILIVALASLLNSEAEGAGSSLPPVLRGSVLAGFLLIGIARVTAMESASAGLRGAVPVALSGFALSRYLLWGTLTLLPTGAYVLWAAAPAGRPWSHLLTVWLWLTLAGVWVDALRHLSWRWFDNVLCGFPAVALLGALPAAVDGSEAWFGLEASPRLLSAALGGMLARALWVAPQWLPTQSPKALPPRRRWIGGLLKRRVRALTPSQVLVKLGVGPFGVVAILSALLIYIVWFVVLIALDTSPVGDGVGAFAALIVVLLCATYITYALRQASARWALLRAYPLSRTSVWGGAVLSMFTVSVFALGSFTKMHFDGNPAGIVGNFEFRGYGHLRSGLSRMQPALRTPRWMEADGATQDRPESMRTPVRGRCELRPGMYPRGMWSSYSGWEAPDIPDERQYFFDAVRYYLGLVHGVDVTDEELQSALGKPLVWGPNTVQVPAQHLFEYELSRGSGRFKRVAEESAGHVRVEFTEQWSLPQSSDPWKEAKKIEFTPRSTYAFASALERLQTRIADRLERAALLRFVLDLCLLLLAILLFVRLALIEGPLRLAMPLLALLPVGLWYGGRGTATHRAIRDMHLAHPWAAPILTMVVITLLLISIRRQVGQATPRALSGSGLFH